MIAPPLIAHVAAGGLAILSGAAAVTVRKGEPAHRAFGTVFFLSMLIMSALGVYLAVSLPQDVATAVLPRRASIAVGAFTFYLVATAWMTARRKERGVGLFEYAALFVVMTAATALLVFGLEAAASPTGRLEGAPPAPYFVFAGLAAFTAALDLKMILSGGVSGPARVARHLWRMCFALFFAAAFFFVGQQKVMPAFLHGAPILYVLGFAPLAVMIFWLIRVRLTNWLKSDAAA